MFENRDEAGKLLAKELKKFNFTNPVVVALPRGGIPIAIQVAKELGGKLDLIFVKKIPDTLSKEVAIGSVSGEESVYLDEEFIKKYEIDNDYIKKEIEKNLEEIKKDIKKYNIINISKKDKNVILVDDGIATGSSIYLAAKTIAKEKPKTITIASPISPDNKDLIDMLKNVSDNLVILKKASPFMGVSRWYKDFHQLDEKEVKDLLLRYKDASINRQNSF